MSLWAIISDIHGNLEALMAVAEDISQHDVERIICLGDIVGYGPNPCECVDQVMQGCDVVILGNHDQGALFDPEGFNPSAERAIFWTRAQLENATDPDAQKRWEFLGERPRRVEEGPFLFVHGSARHPLNEYVFPEDVYNERKMERIFQLVGNYCFQGHTHVPGVFTADMKFFSPSEVGHRFEFDDTKALVNVGSVGQPRDGDPRACYVLLDPGALRAKWEKAIEAATGVPAPRESDSGGSSNGGVVRSDRPNIEYRRIEYDVDATIRKIHAIPELERFLGDRLRDGR